MCNFTHFLNEKMIANILTGSRIILSLILLKCNGIIFWILYTICGHATAELIYSRANSDKEHMGLTNWKNSPDGLIYKYDVVIAKKYLNEEEMNNLKDLTNMFLVFAEDEAKQRHVMTMKDWINATDDLLKFRRKEVLNNSGSISHKEAVEKAEKEYEKFRIIQDRKYISSMDEFYKKYLGENKYED